MCVVNLQHFCKLHTSSFPSFHRNRFLLVGIKLYNILKLNSFNLFSLTLTIILIKTLFHICNGYEIMECSVQQDMSEGQK